MPISLPVARDEITAELDYERGRLVYEGVMVMKFADRFCPAVFG